MQQLAPLPPLHHPASASQHHAPAFEQHTATDAGDAAEQLPVTRKRKRKHQAAGGPSTMAAIVKQQAARGAPRKWRQEWVSVRSIIGGGLLRIKKWVTDGPPPEPTPVWPDAGAGGGQQQQQPQDAGPSAAAAGVQLPPAAAAAEGFGGAASPLPPLPAPPVHVCVHPGCGRVFGGAPALARHVTHKHTPKTFKCRSCSRAFTDADKLKKHRAKQHADEW